MTANSTYRRIHPHPYHHGNRQDDGIISRTLKALISWIQTGLLVSFIWGCCYLLYRLYLSEMP